MATRYHVNPVTGEYGVCRAEKGKCPFGGTTGNENHFTTEKEARKASEAIYAGLNEQKSLSKDSIHHDGVRRKNNPRNLTPDELLEEWYAEQQAYYDSFEATGGFDEYFDEYFDDEPGDIDETKSTSSSRWNKVFNAISNKLPWN